MSFSFSLGRCWNWKVLTQSCCNILLTGLLFKRKPRGITEHASNCQVSFKECAFEETIYSFHTSVENYSATEPTRARGRAIQPRDRSLCRLDCWVPAKLLLKNSLVLVYIWEHVCEYSNAVSCFARTWGFHDTWSRLALHLGLLPMGSPAKPFFYGLWPNLTFSLSLPR